MKPSVYLETTIVSYLTAWPSRDLVMAANQATTREWWTTRKDEFDLYISQPVIQESNAGDSEAAARRWEILQHIQRLTISQEVENLAASIITDVPLPAKAQTDALHIAASAVNGINYLLTWNCTHIANATLRPRIEAVCQTAGYKPPVICTPQELLGREIDVT
jgi:hypothetical protein